MPIELNEDDLLQSSRKGRKSREERLAHYHGKYSVKNAKKKAIQYTPTLSVGDQIRIAAGYPQAIVKVTNYGKGRAKILGHLRYISRHSTLALEDQDGMLLSSVNDFIELLNTWDSLYFDTRKNARDTVHMTFSAPEGSNRSSVLRATRLLLQEEYGKQHDYVFVAHQDTKHPHVHAVIVMRSHEGRKMDPRKQYLLRLRKKFAAKCRQEGIRIEASRRYERGLSGKAMPSPVAHMIAKRKVQPDINQRLFNRIKDEMSLATRPTLSGEIRMLQRNQTLRKLFANTARKITNTLSSQQNTEDQRKHMTVSRLLDTYARTMPREETRSAYFRRFLDQRSSSKSTSLSDEQQLRYEQYLAVTQGDLNKDGIYTISSKQLRDFDHRQHSVDSRNEYNHTLDKTLDIDNDLNFE